MNRLTVEQGRMREVIAIAGTAAEKGNRPFGALLVSATGDTLARAENSQVTDGQVLAHAEMNLLLKAVQQYDQDILAGCTLYASAEPCAMCAGALFWSGIGRLVFGLSNQRLHELQGDNPRQLKVGAKGVLEGAGRHVEIVGPLLEEEAASIFSRS